MPVDRKLLRIALDAFFALASIGSLAILIVQGMGPVHTDTFAATDFKTLYASTVCFAHGQNAYTFAGLEAVFHANAVTLPTTWTAHAPVYPPMTLAFLAPLSLLPMVTAGWVTFTATVLLLMLAVFRLLRYADRELRLPLLGSVLLAGLCTAPQIVPFALTIGNVSVAASALGIIAFTRLQQDSTRDIWINSILMAMALLLKPHLAAWIVLAAFLLPQRPSRRAAFGAAALFTAFSITTFAVLAVTGKLMLQISGYLQMLHAESTGAGSMSPASRAILPVVAQIPSLKSLVGFWTASPAAETVVSLAALATFAILLVRFTRRLSPGPASGLLVAACCTFGLIATYHRAHDALILLLVLPWILAQLFRRPGRWEAWVMLIALALITSGPADTTIAKVLQNHSMQSFLAFLLLRQTALAALGLMLVLLLALRRQHDPLETVHRAPVS